ncbi:POU domain class 2-associating factor 1 isoform X2 [Tachysurus fulvidraco]|uniref:POU domain class 2-associating factor 1 isoform X2 n=1 Tax=Tachysurus fulvidraco TaxID=1234273 RepID=UPI000F4F5382|nr:POU domain class 2-associating factor 1 isoform X2 [Tachysurus fulvidraco]
MGKSLSEQAASKPYQGVRVKDPVKELLRRKRGNTARTVPPTAGYRFLTPRLLSEGSSGFPGSSQSALNDTSVDVGALCPGWVAQPSSTAAFQPLGHWAPSEYFQHEQSLSTLPPLTSDMYVQPVCPSYAVVGPSSVLTFAHTPLFTNLGTISSSSSGLPQIDVQDGSLAYIPWATPMSPCPQNVAPQPLAMPVPVPVSEPEPQQKEPAPTSEGTLALEKLLEEEEEQKEPYACSPSLFTQDI